MRIFSAATLIRICPPGRNTRYISLSASRSISSSSAYSTSNEVTRSNWPAGKGRHGGRRAGDTALAAVARVREAAPGEVDAPGASELPEHLQVVAGAAAAVEDPRRLDAAGRLGEQRLDETAESVEPEVIAFGPCRGFEQAVHR